MGPEIVNSNKEVQKGLSDLAGPLKELLAPKPSSKHSRENDEDKNEETKEKDVDESNPVAEKNSSQKPPQDTQPPSLKLTWNPTQTQEDQEYPTQLGGQQIISPSSQEESDRIIQEQNERIRMLETRVKLIEEQIDANKRLLNPQNEQEGETEKTKHAIQPARSKKPPTRLQPPVV